MVRTPHPLRQRYPGGDEMKDALPKISLLKSKHWDFVKKRYFITDRELQIAKYVCNGYSNEDIAAALKISEGTVKTHIRNIYRKTWVHNKISMLLRFIEDINTHTGDIRIFNDD